jgi:periplasmic divalent cation tolerance protein
MSEPFIVWCSAPDRQTAERLARGMLEARLAACVTLGAPVRSFYRWRNALEEADEIPLVIKTRAELFDALEAWVRAHHPYEVPEILGAPAVRGSADYVEWITQETRTAEP